MSELQQQGNSSNGPKDNFEDDLYSEDSSNHEKDTVNKPDEDEDYGKIFDSPAPDEGPVHDENNSPSGTRAQSSPGHFPPLNMPTPAAPSTQHDIQRLIDSAQAEASFLSEPWHSSPPVICNQNQPLPSSLSDSILQNIKMLQTAPVSSLPPRPPASRVPAPHNLEVFHYPTQPVTSSVILSPTFVQTPVSLIQTSQLPDSRSEEACYPPKFSDVAYGSPQYVSRIYTEYENLERRYAETGKLGRFPDRTRLFVGNVYAERVSRRQMFEVFWPYGRIAQISIKPKYGFVQYHDKEEAIAAVKSVTNVELGGKTLKIEICRPQSSDRGLPHHGRHGERKHSPDQRGRGGRNVSRVNDVPHHCDRRSPSLHPHHYNRDYRSSHGRSRSRSPQRHRSSGTYRNRTPDHRDSFARYDVQIFVTNTVRREFVDWVVSCLNDKGLTTKVDNLFHQPPFGDIQTDLARRGVHATVQVCKEDGENAAVEFRIFHHESDGTITYSHFGPQAVPIAVSVISQRVGAATRQTTNYRYASLVPAPVPQQYPQQMQYPALQQYITSPAEIQTQRLDSNGTFAPTQRNPQQITQAFAASWNASGTSSNSTLPFQHQRDAPSQHDLRSLDIKAQNPPQTLPSRGIAHTIIENASNFR